MTILDSDLTLAFLATHPNRNNNFGQEHFIMTSTLGGIDPHRDNFTVGIIDPAGIAIAHEAFDNDTSGYLGAIDMFIEHGVGQVGIEGSAKLGAHVAIALVAAGFDCREVPPSRSAAQRRSRRLEKTDAVDAIATARALWAEPTLGPVQTLEVYDPVVAEIEAVLEHRRSLWYHAELSRFITSLISSTSCQPRSAISSQSKVTPCNACALSAQSTPLGSPLALALTGSPG